MNLQSWAQWAAIAAVGVVVLFNYTQDIEEDAKSEARTESFITTAEAWHEIMREDVEELRDIDAQQNAANLQRNAEQDVAIARLEERFHLMFESGGTE